MTKDTSQPRHDQPDLSVIVPLYNEEENVERMYRAIDDALKPTDHRYEIIFVDDGSRDKTAEIVRRLTESEPNLCFIRFRRNYGQTPAMAAGIDHARGRVLVTMDGDLQNDPLDIPTMVDQISDDVDMVVGWRVKRQDKLITRKIPSIIANRLIGRVTGVPIKDNGCSLKAYKAQVIKEVPLYSELHRFIPAMASITGARVKQVPVRHHARQFGESKYGLGRIYRVLFDLLIVKTVTRFSSRPLRWFTVLAVGPIALSLVLLIIMGSLAISGDHSLTVLSAVFLQLFGLAVFLIVCGAIGELIFKQSGVETHQLPTLTAATQVTLLRKKSQRKSEPNKGNGHE